MIPHQLPGANTRLAEFAILHGLPAEAARGGAQTMYPEYVENMKSMKPASATAIK